MSLEYIAALNKKDYQDAAKYEDYEMKAIKRPPLQIDFKVAKNSNRDKMTNRDDVARLEARDNAIEAEMERVTNLAIPDMPNKFKPIVNEVTAEMIADYQEEQRKPLEIDGKFYPYHPVDLELDLEQIPELQTTQTEDRDRLLKEQEDRVLKNIALIEAQIELLDKEIYGASQQYDSNIAQIQSDNEYGYTTNEEARDLYREQVNDFEEYNKTAVLTREQLSKRLDNASRQVYSISDRRYRDEEEFSQNKAEIARIKNENAKQLRDAETTFNILNQGRTTISRLPDETEEQYAERLAQTSQPPEIDPETLAERVVMRETEKLIANLKTILKPEQASNIAKMITPKQKSSFNKFFPKIKKAYEKTYSKTVKVAERELIDFFLATIGETEPEEAPYTQPPAERRARPPRAPRAPAPLTPEDEYRRLAGEYERLGRAAEAEGEFPVAEGRLITPLASSFKNKDLIRAYLAANHPDDPRYKRLKPQASRAETEQVYKEIVGEVEPRYRPLEFPLKGEGIHTKALPKRAHFGKVSINPHNLYHKNLLQVRNLKGQAIGVSDIKVSDGMSEMLLKMLEGVNPSKKDFAILEKGEPSLYNNLIHLAQLHKNYETPNLNETKQQMKHRMELVQGEIEAGNTAPSILSEAKQLLRLMVGNGMLKSPAARKHYEYLKNFN
jgi:hypothetical protein